MARTGDAVHRRLQQAALELFCELGYDQTTATAIAARAGVTERTYFRHFADKRDILFDGGERLQTLLGEAIAAAPAGLAPIPILRRALDALLPVFEANRAFSEPRQAIIAATPALREREMSKQADLAAAVADALAKRGVAADIASLSAHLAGAAFNHALAQWLGDPAGDLGGYIDRAFEHMRLLSS